MSHKEEQEIGVSFSFDPLQGCSETESCCNIWCRLKTKIFLLGFTLALKVPTDLQCFGFQRSSFVVVSVTGIDNSVS